MDGTKKSSKKSFSVPSVKRKDIDNADTPKTEELQMKDQTQVPKKKGDRKSKEKKSKGADSAIATIRTEESQTKNHSQVTKTKRISKTKEKKSKTVDPAIVVQMSEELQTKELSQVPKKKGTNKTKESNQDARSSFTVPESSKFTKDKENTDKKEKKAKSHQSKNKNFRALTDAEYEDIFKAVIQAVSSPQQLHEGEVHSDGEKACLEENEAGEREVDTFTDKDKDDEAIEREILEKKNTLMSDSTVKNGMACNEENEGCVQLAIVEKSEEQSDSKEKKESMCEAAEKHDTEPEEEEDNTDLESLVSQDSVRSGLMVEEDVAIGVNQMERHGPAQQSNERTPQAEARERESHPLTPPPGEAHKPKKRKQRKNQLAPRKLCFDMPVKSSPPVSESSVLPKKNNKFQKAAGEPDFRRKKKMSLQAAVKQDAGTEKQHVLEAEVPAEMGTWVQCCQQSCNKWRYLAHVHDPAEVSDLWTCSMHPDKEYNSCDKAEQAYDDSDHIMTQYTLGSLVWAKMDGFPWWPAVVDTDPDHDLYCEIPHENTMVPSDYHVVFLDETVTRSWVKKTRIRQLLQAHLPLGSSYLKGHKYKKEVGVAMKRAELALALPLQERLNTFGFAACFRNERTRWSKAEMKRKRPGHKKVQKKSSKPGATKAPGVKKAIYSSDSDIDSDSCGKGYSTDNSAQFSSDSDFSMHSRHKQLFVQNKKPGSLSKNVQLKGKHRARDSTRDTEKGTKKMRRHDSVSDWSDSDKNPTVLTPSTNTGPSAVSSGSKIKKLFKSEMAKKRDAEMKHRQGLEKKDACELSEATQKGTKVKDCKKRKEQDGPKTGSDGTTKKKLKLSKNPLAVKEKSVVKTTERQGHSSEKTIKTKSQKFVAPAKLMSENRSSETKPLVTSTSKETVMKNRTSPQDKPFTGILKDKSSPKDKHTMESLEGKSSQTKTFSDVSSSEVTLAKNLPVSDSDEDDSPLLNSKNKDQFVPSVDSDEDDSDGSHLDIKEQLMDSKEKGSKQLTDGDSDSDCLDIEEDLPIPSLQQVLSVESKGFSDQEGFNSDPLELAED